jgi:hypothetical protein
MTDSERIDFYLRHRTQIEEWSALRADAEAELDAALKSAIAASMLDEPEQHTTGVAWRGTHLFLPVSAELPRIGTALWWPPKNALTPSSGVVLAVTALDGRADPERERLQLATTGLKDRLGMAGGVNEWVWTRRIHLPDGSTDLEGFARSCVNEARALSIEVRLALMAPTTTD